MARGLNYLAGLYQAQGHNVEAEPLYQRALAVLEKAFGPEHPKLAVSLGNYAIVLRGTGRDDLATTVDLRAKAIRAKYTEQNPVQ